MVLEYYWKSLIKLKIPPDTKVEFCFVDDSEDQINWMWWQNTSHKPTVIQSDPRPADATYAIGVQHHEWQVATFEHLARQKQKLIQHATEHHFDYFFLVDSDLLLEPTTLISAISLGAPIANAVFWTQWTKGVTPMPQVWLRNPYEMRGLGMQSHEFLKDMAERRIVRVIGGGACTLFDTRIFTHCRYHPRFKGLPTEGMWQGEDRTMAITAQQTHIDQFADGWPDIFHAYHPHMRTEEVLSEVFAHQQAPRQLFANLGDLVSFEITAMDITIPGDTVPQRVAQRMQDLQKNLYDPRVKLVRGRLGALRIAPELEAALFEMSPGQSRLIKIKFPHYTDMPDYANQTKTMKLSLHDVKEYGFAPILSEDLLQGVL